MTHLAAGFRRRRDRGCYGGTRLGRQELDGELIEDVEGALWTRALIETSAARRRRRRWRGWWSGSIRRRGAAATPAGSWRAGWARTGSAMCSATAASSGLAPEGWARAVVAGGRGLGRRPGGRRDQPGRRDGGERAAERRRALPVRPVRARFGKGRRAEPVAALFERGQGAVRRGVSGAGGPALRADGGGGYEGPGRSPGPGGCDGLGDGGAAARRQTGRRGCGAIVKRCENQGSSHSATLPSTAGESEGDRHEMVRPEGRPGGRAAFSVFGVAAGRSRASPGRAPTRRRCARPISAIRWRSGRCGWWRRASAWAPVYARADGAAQRRRRRWSRAGAARDGGDAAAAARQCLRAGAAGRRGRCRRSCSRCGPSG